MNLRFRHTRTLKASEVQSSDILLDSDVTGEVRCTYSVPDPSMVAIEFVHGERLYLMRDQEVLASIWCVRRPGPTAG
jgi:hypothetical protein